MLSPFSNGLFARNRFRDAQQRASLFAAGFRPAPQPKLRNRAQLPDVDASRVVIAQRRSVLKAIGAILGLRAVGLSAGSKLSGEPSPASQSVAYMPGDELASRT